MDKVPSEEHAWLSGAARPVGTVLGRECCLGLRLPLCPDSRALGLPSNGRSGRLALGDPPESPNGSSPCKQMSLLFCYAH